jgi:hypothetical protein
MKLKIISCALICASGYVAAQSSSVSIVPQSAMYVGLGASENSIGYNNQNTYGRGTSYTPPATNALGQPQASITGAAAGSTGVTLPNQNTAAPSLQAGFFNHFANSEWMWGGKFAYSYLGTTSSSQNMLIPQSGGFTQGGVFTPFNGNYVVRSYQSTINHQMSFMPYFGKSFERSFVYFGAGPTLAQTKYNINQITGFADINGLTTSVTGLSQPSSYSASQWTWGAGAVIGGTYFIDKSWFLDMSYTYSVTGNPTANWGGNWSDSPAVGAPRTGTNAGTSSGNITTQAVTITLNKAF